jgi:threonylcarbamoyladenosine tRNA methylthiotransferase MtaB
MKKAAVHNLGCKVNSYEADSMCRMLKEDGYEIVDYTQRADVYVINTCTVTNIADRKSRQMLHKVRRENPDAIVVAAGCYVQVQQAQSLKEDGVDIILGNNVKHELIEQIHELERSRGEEKEMVSHVVDLSKEQHYESMGILSEGERTRAFLKVQDGCNQFCSYCIIPYARGRVRSRALRDVVTECETMAAGGYREVVLTGIHLSSYGVDNGSSLLELLQEVSKVDGIERIRMGSLEPGIITETFLDALQALPKVCPHFHLSLQSGCSATLKRMNRRYTAEEYAAKCELLRRYYDRPAITTDIIVGFPQETEEEFEETCAFAQRIAFYEVHVFKYSRRNGTKAADMPGQIPEQVKTQRSHRLMQIVQQMKAEYEQAYIGRKTSVLLEEEVEVNGETYLTGFTPEYVKVLCSKDAGESGSIVTGTVKKDAPNFSLLLFENILQ